ncbi:shikimate kinase [Camelliibacillus cellulosilyticus]|uniref:Shikimate kinase n=1 Tax=Camelliibacillus cellulosilyticus TaxID=2174486 RepID=A0ABV9GIM7_9BACL
MDTIFLTGFMGAGKTTVGRELGQAMGMSVYDTDALIEQLLKKPIPVIFEDDGEAAFREYEEKVLRSVAGHGAVVTTGGGIILKETNRRIMRQNGIVIYLHTDPETILHRLHDDTERPLLKNQRPKQVSSMLAARLPLYLEADYTVNTSMKSVETIVDEISAFLVRHQRFWA